MNAWKKVEEMMGDRGISHKLKGNLLISCVTPHEWTRDAMAETRGEGPGLQNQPGMNNRGS